VGIPTDTVYGLAARLSDPVAVEHLFALKGRAATKAMAVLVADFDAADALGEFDAAAARLARRFWPGALTVVVHRRAGVDVDLGGDPSTIGLRCPDLGVIRELAREVGPIVTTSANRSGEPTLATAPEIADAFGSNLAAVLDGGRLTDRASTVVDLSGTGLVVLREGPITTAQLLDLS
jgi:tRNA threonylcarbamoyl adenosine modification protein (Sua5/YciO/YrdC/YwlC family)